MTNRVLHTLILLLFVFLSTSCGLFDSGEPDEPEFENEFWFELNEEPFWGEPYALIFPTSADSALDFFGARLNSSDVPYLQKLSFRVILEEGQSTYSVLRELQSTPPMQLVGGFFSELDGDAPIAQYIPIVSDLNRLEINRGSSEFGPIVFGEFSLAAVVEENVTEFGQRNRSLPDTLRITNGRFRVLLSQRDD